MIEEFEYNGKAMGTEYNIIIVSYSKEIADKATKVARDYIEQYEQCFSRFLPSSELSELNKRKKMVVSSMFMDVTLIAYNLFVITKGIFNPLLSIDRFGYDKNFKDIDKDTNIDNDDFYDIDFSSVIIDKEKSLIQLNQLQNLDYGGLLKGYLSELIAKKIKLDFKEVQGVIINLGGDIYTEGLDKNNNKFVFSIYNPVLDNNDTEVTLYNQGLATSGTYKRSWFNLGKKVHHILDIFGKENPNTDIISSSVICESGSKAEAYTKVFLSMDHDNAVLLLEDKNISFIIIKNDGKVIKNI